MQAVSERKKNLEGMSMVVTAFQDAERFHEEEKSGLVQLSPLSWTFSTSDAASDSNWCNRT